MLYEIHPIYFYIFIIILIGCFALISLGKIFNITVLEEKGFFYLVTWVFIFLLFLVVGGIIHFFHNDVAQAISNNTYVSKYPHGFQLVFISAIADYNKTLSANKTSFNESDCYPPNFNEVGICVRNTADSQIPTYIVVGVSKKIEDDFLYIPFGKYTFIKNMSNTSKIDAAKMHEFQMIVLKRIKKQSEKAIVYSRSRSFVASLLQNLKITAVILEFKIFAGVEGVQGMYASSINDYLEIYKKATALEIILNLIRMFGLPAIVLGLAIGLLGPFFRYVSGFLFGMGFSFFCFFPLLVFFLFSFFMGHIMDVGHLFLSNNPNTELAVYNLDKGYWIAHGENIGDIGKMIENAVKDPASIPSSISSLVGSLGIILPDASAKDAIYFAQETATIDLLLNLCLFGCGALCFVIGLAIFSIFSDQQNVIFGRKLI